MPYSSPLDAFAALFQCSVNELRSEKKNFASDPAKHSLRLNESVRNCIISRSRRRRMAISGDLRVNMPLASFPAHPLRRSAAPSKVGYSGFLTGGSGISDVAPKWPHIELEGRNIRCHYNRPSGIGGETAKTLNQEAEGFLLNAIHMSFFERLNLAWKILFPSPVTKRNSNANIAKQRLKMILFSDRCAVSDEAKQKIVKNIVNALSDFVEIDSQDKVQLSVSTDADLGTVYSVTVPVRRVKAEYQEDDEYGTITNIEYKDTGESSGSVDVKFDFFLPNEKFQ